MGWFGPSGICGCCDVPAIDCELLDCADYTVATCQCVDFQTGSIRTLVSVDWVLTGTTTGGSTPVIGGLSSLSLPAIDYSGTYNFLATPTGSVCSTLTSDIHIIDKRLIGTESGSDYWAILYMRQDFVGGFTRVALTSAVVTVAIGDEPESPSTTFSIFQILENVVILQDELPCLGDPAVVFCLCQRDDIVISNDYTNPTPGRGHGLAGAGLPSGYADWLYA